MDEQQARLILQSYRPGDADRSDPHFAAALEEAEGNTALAEWLVEEQAFDRAMTAHLESVPAPFGLKTRILAQGAAPVRSFKTGWVVGLAALAALLFLLVQVAGLWRSPGSASATLPNYAEEMVSFIRISPSLEMESSDLGTIKDWLSKKEGIAVEVPARLAVLQPVGCRVLSFRGRDVTLICFSREGDRLAHLFVVDRAALPELKSGAAPVFSSEGEWMTASWAEKDRAYMIALQGDRAAAQRYLPDA